MTRVEPWAVFPRMAVASPAVFPKLGAESLGLRAFPDRILPETMAFRHRRP
jgi:hypothetical protein